MRYAVRHKKTKQFLYIGEESGTFLTDDGKYGILTYKIREYAEEFLTELFEYGGIYDDGGTIDSDEMFAEDFEIVEV